MTGGGWGRRGLGIPLAERVRTGSTDPADAGTLASPARHCWVSGVVDDDGIERPGLLVEWRRGVRGWEGRVVYSARLGGREWGLVEHWLPADRLTPR